MECSGKSADHSKPDLGQTVSTLPLRIEKKLSGVTYSLLADVDKPADAVKGMSLSQQVALGQSIIELAKATTTKSDIVLRFVKDQIFEETNNQLADANATYIENLPDFLVSSLYIIQAERKDCIPDTATQLDNLVAGMSCDLPGIEPQHETKANVEQKGLFGQALDAITRYVAPRAEESLAKMKLIASWNSSYTDMLEQADLYHRDPNNKPKR